MFETHHASGYLRKSMASLLTLAVTLGPTVVPAFASPNKVQSKAPASKRAAVTATPIQYLVVIFNENVSFDHYFGTYPNALNPAGENKFIAKATTPSINGLSGALLTANPNLNAANGAGATNPYRLDISQAATADQDHAYGPEQQAADSGLMDLFPLYTGTAGPPPGGGGINSTTGLVMGYFDGNTVTALWNYAQNFAMSDNSFGTNFGPSTVGLMNLVAGQTNGVVSSLNGTGSFVPDGNGGYTNIDDPDPIGDVCSNPSRNQAQMGGLTVFDLLNSAGVSWGAFMGGFDLTIVNQNGTTGCSRTTKSYVTGTTESDYIPHHSLTSYWPSIANLTHARPCGEAFGTAGCANHNYDIQDFYTAVQSGQQPAVSFIKAPGYQDGHAGYSDPLDEQESVVSIINFLQNPANNPNWASTAVVIAYDDSDGWYDHVMGPIVNTSQGPDDALTAPGYCGTAAPALSGISGPHALGRCGYGPRLPLLVISPWAKDNYVDHTVTDQSSIIHFIEDNWLGGQRIGGGSFDAIANSIAQNFDFAKVRKNGTLCLNPLTGEKEKPSFCGL